MSSLVNPSRVRAPRTAGAAIERARLALVPARASHAPRAPFAVLVFVILGAGVVGLLMFNTHMQQASFYATSLQQRADALAAKRQSLEMEMAQIRNPQALAIAGKKLGMVVPPVPASLDLRTGKISGVVTPAGPADRMPVTAPPASLPHALNLTPRKVFVKVAPTGTTGTTGKTGKAGKGAKNSGHSQTPHGPASP